MAFQPHWLEAAIGDKRMPADIAQAIAAHPDFLALLAESVSFAQQNAVGAAQQTQFIAEHIVSRLHQSMDGFTTML